MKTSRTGIGFITTILACLFAVGSCHYGEPYIEPYVAPQAHVKSLPEICRPFYGDGTDRWINCIGVPLK